MQNELFESLESRRLFAGLTIISHAFNGGLGGFMDVQTAGIADRLGGMSKMSGYQLTVGATNGQLVVKSMNRISGTTAANAAPSGEIVLQLNWGTISATLDYSLATIANVFSNYLLNTKVDNIKLTELPIHMISLSRGDGFIDELAKGLGKAGVWVDQETYMDPYPVPGMADTPSTVYDNVAFVDNYWRSEVNPTGSHGMPVEGAWNTRLQFLDATYSSLGRSPHLAPTSYYTGTVNLTATQGGYGPIISSWYQGTVEKPARDQTGYYYSRLIGGARPIEGVWAPSGGTGSRNTPTGQFGQQWANITDVAATYGTIASGQNITIKYISQDRDDASTITFSLDNDNTPYNGMGSLLGTKAVGASSTVDAGNASFSTSGIAAGTYYIVARIVDGQGHTRYAYSRAITLTASGSGQSTFLSDISPTSATNGYGPFAKDKSNGENGVADGTTIKLNGTSYTKGIGVHASSNLVFSLAGNYARFTASIGVDDEVGSMGSVVFRVQVDGTTIYTSPLMTGASATIPLDLDVTGKQILTLMVLDGGDNIAADHGDWANAKLSPASTVVPPSEPTDPTPAGTTYLSTLNPTSWTNGYGSYEKNQSNGESGTGDGNTITLNGTTYAKGLGTHAGSDITYSLTGGGYKSFTTDMGMDDEVGNNGSVKFMIYLDGVLAYDSGVMGGASVTKSAALDVTGKSLLRLVVTDGGDGNGYDHGDWAGAALSTTALPTPPVVVPPSGATYISALTPTSSTNAWGPIENNKSNGESALGDGTTITLNGVTYTKGVGVHAGSEIVYNLGGAYKSFTSDVGLDDEIGNQGSVVFQVFADGTKIYDSGTMYGASATKKIAIDVTGKSTLRLVVTDNGDGADHDHADWASALVSTDALPTPPVVVPPPANSFASDLTAVSSTNAWGPYEKDMSNGEFAAGDGKTITLNGTTYTKGIGVHAGSEIIFTVPTGSTSFKSDLGVDDEVGNNGSVIFKVYQGTTLLFASTKITGASATQSVNVAVTGGSQLRLVVEDGGDGPDSDHADWANARFA